MVSIKFCYIKHNDLVKKKQQLTWTYQMVIQSIVHLVRPNT